MAPSDGKLVYSGAPCGENEGLFSEVMCSLVVFCVNHREMDVYLNNDILQGDKGLSPDPLNTKAIILKCSWIASFEKTGP